MVRLAATLFSVIGTVAASISNSERSLRVEQASRSTDAAASVAPDVKGLAFNRFYQIWMENEDYSGVADNPDLNWLASKGIKLTNYFATGHTSEPNYCASAGGDSFGMDGDDLHLIPTSVSTVANLLDVRGVSWAEYQEGIPHSGFEGIQSLNSDTYAVEYVRRHNPLILFNSTVNNDTALRQIKSFADFYNDLNQNSLPQWAFLTPNMTNDGHNTNVAFSSKWLRSFVSEIMNNTYFWNDTLLLLTFDESKHYSSPNRVLSILLGGAVPQGLAGTVDGTMYSHYSAIASVSANWGLPSLGRWDCGANLFEVVANKTGYKNWVVDISALFMNVSLPGPLSSRKYSRHRASWPVPSTNDSCSAGNGILQAVIDAYKGSTPTYNYTTPFPYDVSAGLDLGVSYSRNESTYISGVNSTFSTETNTGSATSGSDSSLAAARKGATLLTAVHTSVNGITLVVLILILLNWTFVR